MLKFLGICPDEVKGIVIGGDDHRVKWRLFYDGRPQCQEQYAANDKEAVELAKKKLEAIKADCGEAYRWIYPDKEKWEVRIWDL